MSVHPPIGYSLSPFPVLREHGSGSGKNAKVKSMRRLWQMPLYGQSVAPAAVMTYTRLA